MTVWDVFEAVATRHGERIAVEVQRAQSLDAWTYHDLHTTALAQATRLAAMGVRPGDRCAIFAHNDARWCAAYLGILRQGAVAVPLDTSYTAPQAAAILADARPTVVFVDERLADIARDAVGTDCGIRLQPLGSRADGPSTAAHAIDPTSPAVILYTAGTTAEPKGVVLSHANLLAQRDAASTVLDINASDSVLGVLPLAGAFAQFASLLLPFAVGARVVYLETVNASELIRALRERGITVFPCVPQFLSQIHERLLAEFAGAGVVKRVIFRVLLRCNFRLRRSGINGGRWFFHRVHSLVGRHIRLFVTAGSKFDPVVGCDLYALGFTILQAYSLTETAGPAALTRADDAHLDTLGQPLPGNEIRILSSHDPERDGEVAIRGPIVMHGYFNRPEATVAVMRDGWFLTGDLGRLDASGRLTITARKKEVIALASGKNIYPAEVEAQYRQSPYVKEICVMALTREKHSTSERLFAVVVPNMTLLRERRIVNAGDLLRFEIEGQSIHLPLHERVQGYDVWFECLPRTTTGHLKRHEIEARVRRKQGEARATIGQSRPSDYWRGDAHAEIAVAIIARHRNGGSIAPSANLELDLALDSMERVELITALERRFGVRVAEAHAHEILTVQELIDAVRPGAVVEGNSAGGDSWSSILGDLPSEDDPMLAALRAQRRVMPVLLFVMLRLLRLVTPRVVVSGRHHLPLSGPYIISPNHQSYLDPFFVCSVLPYRLFHRLFFVGAAEYFETATTAWAARQFSLVPVDPDANLVPAMKAGAFGLSRGRILVLFPEGERSIDGTVKPFKKGAAILSRHLKVPIVPVAIRGVFEVWPRNRPFNWRLLLPWSGHRVRLAFGEPIQLPENVTYAEAATILRQRIEAMWRELDSSLQPGRQQASRDHAARE